MTRQIKNHILHAYRSIKRNIFDLLICFAIALGLVLLGNATFFAQKAANNNVRLKVELNSMVQVRIRTTRACVPWSRSAKRAPHLPSHPRPETDVVVRAHSATFNLHVATELFHETFDQ